MNYIFPLHTTKHKVYVAASSRMQHKMKECHRTILQIQYMGIYGLCTGTMQTRHRRKEIASRNTSMGFCCARCYIIPLQGYLNTYQAVTSPQHRCGLHAVCLILSTLQRLHNVRKACTSFLNVSKVHQASLIMI